MNDSLWQILTVLGLIMAACVVIALIGLLALVMTPIILTGGIDLSVGSTLGLCAVVFGKLWRDAGLPPMVAASSGAAVSTSGRDSRTRKRIRMRRSENRDAECYLRTAGRSTWTNGRSVQLAPFGRRRCTPCERPSEARPTRVCAESEGPPRAFRGDVPSRSIVRAAQRTRFRRFSDRRAAW